MRKIVFKLPTVVSMVVRQLGVVFSRIMSERTGLSVMDEGSGDFTINLRYDDSLGDEGFRIDDIDGGVCIYGCDDRGLVAGVGKLIHDSQYGPGEFTPGSWRGTSIPVMPVRGIYFATHFHNWYHDAPIEKVEHYIEELALWGTNVLSVWFDMHHYTGINDPEAQKMLERLHAMLMAAKRIGMDTGLTTLANEAYADSPESLRAEWVAGQNGYHHEPAGHYHVEICPNKPGGTELILQFAEERMAFFDDIGIDYYWIWPYDQGGCTCSVCAPWGANGFLSIAKEISHRVRARFPQAKIVLSTWYFDHFVNGEWSGLDAAFTNKPDWVDLLLADDYGDDFPAYPLQHGVPGGFKMVGFPEISMYNCNPWGGYGANPLPAHIQSLWNQARTRLIGGFPYSEGIYEDINKAIMAQCYWNPTKPVADTVREYLSAIGVVDVDKVVRAIDILESAFPHHLTFDNGNRHVSFGNTEGAGEAAILLLTVDAEMPEWARVNWRWRILLLRGIIDAELVNNNFIPNAACDIAFNELTKIYHAQKNTNSWVAPPLELIR
jgi:hypothetical protein